MRRLLDLLALLLAAIAFFAIAIFAANKSAVAAIVALSCATGAYSLNKKVKVLSVDEQILAPDSFSLPFVVYGTYRKFIVLTIAVVFLAAPIYPSLHSDPVFALFLSLFAVVALIMLISALKQRRLPALIVGGEGLTLDGYGFISWPEIDRVYLREMSNQGIKHHQLVLHLTEPEKHYERFRRVGRWRALLPFAKTVNPVIRLNFLTFSPKQIDAVVQHVRRQYFEKMGIELRTGDLSIDKRTAEIEQIMGSLRADDPPSKLHLSLNRVESLSHESITELKEEAQTHHKELRVSIIVVVAVVLVWLLVPILSK